MTGNPREFETVIRNGQIMDGTGADPIRADLGIRRGRIAAIGRLAAGAGAREIDAAGLAVAPGFIDVHTHVEQNLPAFPDAPNLLVQGVTTVLAGNCGGGPLSVSALAARMQDEAGTAVPGINVGLLAGHNTLRARVMGSDDRAPAPEELARMKEFLEEALRDGAFGLSSGLFYAPGAFAETEELIELARVAAAHGGIYATHMRNEGLEVFASVEETLRIGREAGIPVHISHLKISAKRMWGRSADLLARIDAARAEGLDVTFDQYPYTASSTGITALFPRWALAGAPAARLARWKESAARARLREEIVFRLTDDRGGRDPANVVLVSSPLDPAFAGMHLGEVSTRLLGDAGFGNAAETAIRLAEAGHHPCVFHSMCEDDVRRIMRHPAGLVASDGGVVGPEQTFPHPRNYGTFPRVLGRYVRGKGVLSLPEAIAKMTGAAARRLGLADRGFVRVGQQADLVVFDPATVADRATWKAPRQVPEGIPYVLVNGAVAVDEGRLTGRRAGCWLRRPRESAGLSAREAAPCFSQPC
jgi:N-acyl-D-amino-acid deacylase